MARLSLRARRLRARGLSKYNSRRWANSHFMTTRMPNRANRAYGTGNAAFTVYARVAGPGGNSIRYAVIVNGLSTPASVSVSGNDVTFNSATNGTGTATSTVNAMITLVNAGQTKVDVELPSTSNGTSVVAAAAMASLSGAT